jgi:PleD family two-component response regulator
MLNTYFSVESYEVSMANAGEEALSVIHDKDLDLVVLDVRLPDIDGFEVCRRLRTQRRTQDVPVIFLTEKRDRVDRLHGLQLGVVDYITKPFDIQELKLRIRNAINRAQQPFITNPITDLPEGPMVDEKLSLLLKDQREWAVLLFRVGNLARFRELYGFVAADDVLRAVTLMIRNAVKEHGDSNDIIAHLNTSDFVIITSANHVEKIRERIQSRVEKSREYFYPLKDRDKVREAMDSGQLNLESTILTHTDGPFATLDAMKRSLMQRATES